VADTLQFKNILSRRNGLRLWYIWRGRVKPSALCVETYSKEDVWKI